MYFEWFIVISVAVVQIDSGKNDPCTTPNGDDGECAPLPSCLTILQRIEPNNESSTRFAQDSLCGWEGIVPWVCCETNKNQLRLVNKEPRAITLNSFDTKALPDRSVCGLQGVESRIFGGEETEVGEFPWMVALEYRDKITKDNVGIKCGGSIINNRFILSAAHCVWDKTIELVSARLGEHNISVDPDCQRCDPVRKMGILRVIPHPHFDTATNNHDIALLEMRREINFTDFIRPICLPPDNLPPLEYKSNLTVSGWGYTGEDVQSDVKLKVEVPVLTNNECEASLSTTFNKVGLRINQLCAGGLLDKDSCRGDSGGPLMRLYETQTGNEKNWYLEGIVSIGVGCGRRGRPAVYTRVNRYINWILHHITSK